MNNFILKEIYSILKKMNFFQYFILNPISSYLNFFISNLFFHLISFKLNWILIIFHFFIFLLNNFFLLINYFFIFNFKIILNIYQFILIIFNYHLYIYYFLVLINKIFNLNNFFH